MFGINLTIKKVKNKTSRIKKKELKTRLSYNRNKEKKEWNFVSKSIVVLRVFQNQFDAFKFLGFFFFIIITRNEIYLFSCKKKNNKNCRMWKSNFIIKNSILIIIFLNIFFIISFLELQDKIYVNDKHLSAINTHTNILFC